MAEGEVGYDAVGSADDVPEGSIAAFQVGQTKVAVAHAGGSWYAFQELCTHRQCSLTEASIEGEVLVCACHGAEFSMVTGEVLGGPAPEPIDIYRATVTGGQLMIDVRAADA
jgi:3-phenylpropionate/trans-cinnamate dioxygenase ferredoxin subunit